MADVTSSGQKRIQSNDGQIKIGITEKDLKITQPEVPALGATVHQMIATSENNLFKIVETGVANVPSISVDSDVGENITQDYSVPRNPDSTTPIVLAYVQNESVQLNIIPDTATNDSTVGTEAWTLGSNLQLGQLLFRQPRQG